MKALPLIAPAGCTLSSDELADQAARAARLLPSVAKLERSADELRVSFGLDVDRALVDELVGTEQRCCSFLDLDYDGAARLLRIEANDAQGREVVGRLAELFGEAR